MPNSVKYSTTTPLNSLRKGNVAIGVNDVDMGPTTSTGWYNGVTPILGNYVIYKTAATGDPDVFAPQSDQELYNFVIMQGGNSSNTTSVGAALAWIATQSDLLAVNNPFSNIVTDGLVLALNAGDVSSYPTTGTTWYDVSGDGNNTSIDSADFNSGGGYFQSVGDAPDSLIFSTPDSTTISNTFSVISGGWTIEELIRIDDTTYPEAAAGTVVSGKAYGSNETGFDWQHGVMSGTSLNIDMSNLNTGGGAVRDAEVNLLIDSDLQTYGQWILRSIYWDRTNDKCGVYYNGRFQDSGSISGVSGYSLYDGGGIVWGTLYGWHHDGARSLMRVYNKVLSESEVLQNYYQSPIVTDGLVLAVDAGNLVSYESGSTVVYNMTGSTSGSLNNGTGYLPDNGGTFDFDGTDDNMTVKSNYTFSSGESYTYEVWFNPTTDNTTSGLIGGQNNPMLRWGQGTPSGKVYFFCGYSESPGYIGVLSNSILPVGEWHHAMATLDSVNKVGKLYINGIFETQFTWSTGTVSVPPSTILFNVRDSSNAYLGKISTGRVYNRALTAAEVAQNYNAQRSRFTP